MKMRRREFFSTAAVAGAGMMAGSRAVGAGCARARRRRAEAADLHAENRAALEEPRPLSECARIVTRRALGRRSGLRAHQPARLENREGPRGLRRRGAQHERPRGRRRLHLDRLQRRRHRREPAGVQAPVRQELRRDREARHEGQAGEGLPHAVGRRPRHVLQPARPTSCGRSRRVWACWPRWIRKTTCASAAWCKSA